MKTWILMAASSTATIYLYDSMAQAIQCTRQVQSRNQKSIVGSKEHSSERFAKYLSEEMELACGAGTNAQLIICAEPKMMPKLMRSLGTQAKTSLFKVLKIGRLNSILNDSKSKNPKIDINSQLVTRLRTMIQSEITVSC